MRVKGCREVNMKIRICPSTLFLCILILCFVIFTPFWLYKQIQKRNSLEYLTPKHESWTGVINLWETPTWDIGCGSRTDWLNKRIREFESLHPDVFIEVKTISIQQVQNFLQSKKESIPNQPDMISYGPGIIDDPEKLFSSLQEGLLKSVRKEIQKSLRYHNEYYAVPWMMGSYCLMVNSDACSSQGIEIPTNKQWSREDFIKAVDKLSYDRIIRGKKKEMVAGFGYSNTNYKLPLLSMIYTIGDTIINKDVISFMNRIQYSYTVLKEQKIKEEAVSVYEEFAKQKKVNIMVASSKELYQLERLVKDGKGVIPSFLYLPGTSKEQSVFFGEQIQYLSVIHQVNQDKETIMLAFLDHMLQSRTQKKLTEIGVFPVIDNLTDLYLGNEGLMILEKTLQGRLMIPNPYLWSNTAADISAILNEVKKWDITTINGLNQYMTKSLTGIN